MSIRPPSPNGRVTWAALATAVIVMTAVAGGAWRVEANMDERFAARAREEKSDRLSQKAEIRQEMTNGYASKVSVEAIRGDLKVINVKLDKLLKDSERRRRR